MAVKMRICRVSIKSKADVGKIFQRMAQNQMNQIPIRRVFVSVVFFIGLLFLSGCSSVRNRTEDYAKNPITVYPPITLPVTVKVKPPVSKYDQGLPVGAHSAIGLQKSKRATLPPNYHQVYDVAKIQLSASSVLQPLLTFSDASAGIIEIKQTVDLNMLIKYLSQHMMSPTFQAVEVDMAHQTIQFNHMDNARGTPYRLNVRKMDQHIEITLTAVEHQTVAVGDVSEVIFKKINQILMHVPLKQLQGVKGLK